MPRADRRQPCTRRGNVTAVVGLPFQEGILHRILGVHAGPEDAVRQAEQDWTSPFELSGGIVAGGHVGGGGVASEGQWVEIAMRFHRLIMAMSAPSAATSCSEKCSRRLARRSSSV